MNAYACRRYVPELKDMPLQYVFEPWKAPLKVQQEVNCVIGQDYPSPIVDHKVASKECKALMEMIKSKSKGNLLPCAFLYFRHASYINKGAAHAFCAH